MDSSFMIIFFSVVLSTYVGISFPLQVMGDVESRKSYGLDVEHTY
jgi:hypothetical protein